MPYQTEVVLTTAEGEEYPFFVPGRPGAAEAERSARAQAAELGRQYPRFAEIVNELRVARIIFPPELTATPGEEVGRWPR
jgi:hypothetical protein